MSDVTMMTPPSEAAPPRGPTVWPTVVGVLGIVWGAFGLLANLCGFLMTPSILKEVLPEEMQEQIISQLPPAQLVLVSGIIGFILSLWLLWGSIKLLQRNAASRTSLNAWSVITILFTIIMAVWMFVTLPPPSALQGDSHAQASQTAVEATETTETTGATDTTNRTDTVEHREQLEPFAVGSPSMQRVNSIINNCCSGVGSCLWPVFLLVFLNTASHRREIETWDDSSAGSEGVFRE